MKEILKNIITLVVVSLVVLEILIEYFIKTLLWLPWRIIKQENIYSYPPLFAYTIDDVSRMWSEYYD